MTSPSSTHARPWPIIVDHLRGLEAEALGVDREELIELTDAASALAAYGRRAEGIDVPPVTVIVGPSGAGKSTLFNILVGETLSFTSSVERPATRGAVAWLPGTSARNLETWGLFAGIDTETTRGKTVTGRTGALSLVLGSRGRQPSVLVDSPDFDTTVDDNRRLTLRIIPWAERAVFVTSTERYADRSARAALTMLRRHGIPVVYVLNKIEGEVTADLTDDFRRHVTELGGLIDSDDTPTTLPRAEGDQLEGELESAAGVSRLRDFLARPVVEALEARGQALAQRTREVVITRLETLEREREGVVADVEQAVRDREAFDPESALGHVAELEDETKLWLRYSPRVLFRGVSTVMKNPKALWRGVAVPGTPEREVVRDRVMDQAWGAFEDVQTVVRETLKKSAIGRAILTSEAVDDADLDREELGRVFEPLIGDIHGFAAAKTQEYRERWSARRRNPFARLRFLLVDRVLKLLMLTLSLTAVPPILYEMLRSTGHRNFVNEVTERYQEFRRDFATRLGEGVERQLAAYRSVVADYGPPAGTARDLARQFDLVESTSETNR